MKTVIASGYFNPFHIGHLRYLQGAAKLGDRLVVIVNNDLQQIRKKGKIIMDMFERAEIVEAMGMVDAVFIAVDKDQTVCASLEKVCERFPSDFFVFANGGDRESSKKVPETAVCKELGMKMVFDAGGTEKLDSSSNINMLTGRE